MFMSQQAAFYAKQMGGSARAFRDVPGIPESNDANRYIPHADHLANQVLSLATQNFDGGLYLYGGVRNHILNLN